jgi:hypothetical protein
MEQAIHTMPQKKQNAWEYKKKVRGNGWNLTVLFKAQP